MGTLGFAGSLRKNSYNRVLLRTAADLMPQNTIFETFDLGHTSIQPRHGEQPPQKNKEFKAKIRNADALLIATPEYNYSIP